MKIEYSYFFSPLIATAVSCSFLFSSIFLLVYEYVQLLSESVCRCAQVCAGMHRCERVCVGMCRCAQCAQVCVGICGLWECAQVCVEYPLETRVLTSADFNMYPIRIFFMPLCKFLATFF